jgi:hypothetical protein
VKKIVLALLLLIQAKAFSQNVLHAGETDWPSTNNTSLEKSMAPLSPAAFCVAGNSLTTGYPAWTNYYAGYMFKINNISACPITIQCFSARFQGTTGYRIYTKTGTFIGFETLSGSWTLVGTAAALTGTSTVAPTDIPITVNVVIPVGQSQSFYLTRTDNVIANRHLYITGSGTAGTTIYASDANIQLTEAEYLDVFFLLQVGVRRPSLDVHYDLSCVLPIELLNFSGQCKNGANNLTWSCATETNNDYFVIERSIDGMNFDEVARIDGAGNSTQQTNYSYSDESFVKDTINYYRLKQVDYNGASEYFNIIAIDDERQKMPTLVKRINTLGEEVKDGYNGMYIEIYSDGSYIKKCCNIKQ